MILHPVDLDTFAACLAPFAFREDPPTIDHAPAAAVKAQIEAQHRVVPLVPVRLTVDEVRNDFLVCVCDHPGIEGRSRDDRECQGERADDGLEELGGVSLDCLHVLNTDLHGLEDPMLGSF